MAVVVQQMVDADVAGVLFTIDPVRQRKDRMVVEAVSAWARPASRARSRPTTPARPDGTVKRQRLSCSLVIERGPEGGIVERELDPSEGEAQTLAEDQLRELARLGHDLQERLERPQDIEWAIEGGTLYVLQARPVTA